MQKRKINTLTQLSNLGEFSFVENFKNEEEKGVMCYAKAKD
jgi:hypothetical protein